MDYIDTSVLVAALTSETSTERIQDWLEGHAETDLVISPWVVTELSAALSVKLRTGAIEPSQRSEALLVSREMIARSFRVLPIYVAHFEAAASIADQTVLGIRAGDALHLAIVLGYGAALRTLDRRLMSGADVLGIPGSLI